MSKESKTQTAKVRFVDPTEVVVHEDRDPNDPRVVRVRKHANKLKDLKKVK